MGVVEELREFRRDGFWATIDRAHDEIHEGEYFTGFHTAAVSSGASLNLGLTIGAKEAHMTFGLTSTAAGTFTLYHSSSFAGGTALSLFNQNETSENVATAALVHTPSITLNGAAVEMHIIGTTGMFTASGGSAGSRDEWVLAPGKKYLLKFIASANATIVATVDFYEEE
jgi:hypothetical protein